MDKEVQMYLGDGVYASFDGYHIWLDLRGQDSTTRIALEPAVLRNLDRFMEVVESLTGNGNEPKKQEADNDTGQSTSQ